MLQPSKNLTGDNNKKWNKVISDSGKCYKKLSFESGTLKNVHWKRTTVKNNSEIGKRKHKGPNVRISIC